MSSNSGFYAYVSNHGKKISVLRMSPETGELTKLQEVRIRGDELPEGVKEKRLQAMALSPDRRFLYVANRTAPYSIHTFAIDGENGTLTHLLESPTVETASFISTDRTGRFLFAAYNASDPKRRPTGFISVAAISEHGFALAPHQVIHTPPKAHSILPDPSNRFVFAPVSDGDMVVRCAFDLATGTLNPDGLSPLYMRAQSGPRHHRYHPNSRFMYINNEYDGTICCYSYDARNGTVSEIQIAHTRPPQMDKDASVRASELRFTPDGKWLYAGVRSLSSIVIFRVDATTGMLMLAGHCEVPKEPRGFNIDPFGRYLLHSAYRSDCVVTYNINSETGALTKVAELPLDGPNYIEIIRLP